MFAHQAFHRWNAFTPWVMDIFGAQWFGEGSTVLYEMKTISKLYIERPYGDMKDELMGYYNTYINEYLRTNKDMAVHDYSALGGDPWIRYRKSAMVNFLIAKEIYLRSGGAQTYDDFLQSMMKNHQRSESSSSCDTACLKEELENLTGTDFTQFFDDYVYGKTELPMQWAFEDDDKDGLSNTFEIGWDTHPLDADTDNDGYSDAEEITKHTNPLDPFSSPSLLYIPIALNN